MEPLFDVINDKMSVLCTTFKAHVGNLVSSKNLLKSEEETKQ